MRVLLSTIGSRGDVQPLVALASELKARDHEVRLCVPPDFCEWIQSLGMAVTPIGPELRKMTASSVAALPPLSPARRRQLAEASVATQFETIAAAARGCDIIVGATALQIAARSVAEKMGLGYVFVAYCPNVLPSIHHAPPMLPPIPGQSPPPANADNRELWARDASRFNDLFGSVLNAHRESIGLAHVSDVRSHVFTEKPWLAADPVLAPWPQSEDQAIFQPGAWILQDERPLDPELELFLDAGEPPIYFGFGSIRAPQGLCQVMIQAARLVNRRAILSRGWADLSLVDDRSDCFAIDEVNQQALFKRVVAVVHHGGAGTTTAAALAGAPQVLVPQMYDQPYWGQRVEQLGIGAAHTTGVPTAESLRVALERTLEHDVTTRAASVAATVRRYGARIAAERVVTLG